MKPPVIFLAFANERDRYLRGLTQEQNNIRAALRPAEKAGLCQVVERPNASIEQILEVFRDYKERVAIFHYGGHADGYRLLLESEEGKNVVAHGGGLVSFLSQQSGLKLIFLNGCSTQQQSKELADAGISAVIGTSQAINDGIASDLSSQFYTGISAGYTLERAWKEAESAIEIKTGKDNYKSLYRSLMFFDEVVSDRLPWELYISPGSEKIKSWNLPEEAQNPLFGLPKLPKVNLPEAPYRFLQRYTYEEADVFFGRGRYIKDLYSRITNPNASPVLLFYGQSGIGKSSLLDAGLFPRLDVDKKYKVLYLRRDADIGLYQMLINELAKPSFMTEELLNNFPTHLEKAESKDTSEEVEHDIQQLSQVLKRLKGRGKIRVEQLIKELKNKQQSKKLNEKAVVNFSRLKKLWKAWETHDKEALIIIVDQLEEVYTRPLDENQGEESELEHFMNEVKELFSEPQSRPMGKLILSYRKEYHPEVNDICKQLEIPREEIFLKQLEKRDIIEVVNGLTMDERLRNFYRVTVEEDLPETIASNLIKDKDSPISPVLQVLLTNMWRLSQEEQERQFTKAKYHNLEARGIMMSDFFAQQVEKFKYEQPEAEKSGLALDLLYYHTTDLGTAESRNPQEIKKRYGERQVVNQVIKSLKKYYLLIQVEGGYTKLAHDTLAPLVRNEFLYSDRIGQRATIVLDNKLVVFRKNPEATLDPDDLAIVEDGKIGMRTWTPEDISLIGQSQKRRDIARFEEEKRLRRQRANVLTSHAQRTERNNPTLALRLAWRATEIDEAPEIKNIFADILSNPENVFYRRRLRGHTRDVNCVAFSSDGREILTGSSDRMMIRWDVSGKRIQTYIGHIKDIVDVAFSPDGKYILSGSTDETAILWNLDGSRKTVYDGHQGAVHAVTFSPDGEFVLTGGSDGKAMLWDLDGHLIQTLEAHEGEVRAIAFSPNGQQILTGGFDKNVILWNFDGERKVEEMTQYSKQPSPVYGVTFSPDAKSFLVGCGNPVLGNGSAVLWEVNGRKRRLQSFEGHTGAVRFLQFSPDGKKILTGSWYQSAVLWNLKGQVIRTLRGHEGLVYAVAFSPDGKQILTGSRDDTGILWDLEDYCEKELRGHSDEVWSVDYSPNGKYLLTSGMDGTAALWNRDKGKIRRKFKGHKGSVWRAVFSPDGSEIMTGGEDGFARIWDLRGNCLRELKGHKKGVLTVAISPDNNFYLTGGEDYMVKLWNKEGVCIHTFIEHEAEINSVAFSPDGQLILAGSGNPPGAGDSDQVTGRVILWDRSGSVIQTFDGHTYAVRSLAFSPDGKYILTGSGDRTAILWDASTGHRLYNFRKHTFAVTFVAFSPDGRRVLTGSWDDTAILWDISGIRLQTFQGYNSDINSLAFSPNGDHILIGYADKFVREWEIAPIGEELFSQEAIAPLDIKWKLQYHMLTVADITDFKECQDAAAYYYWQSKNAVNQEEQLFCLNQSLSLFAKVPDEYLSGRSVSQTINILGTLLTIKLEDEENLLEELKQVLIHTTQRLTTYWDLEKISRAFQTQFIKGLLAHQLPEVKLLEIQDIYIGLCEKLIERTEESVEFDPENFVQDRKRMNAMKTRLAIANQRKIWLLIRKRAFEEAQKIWEVQANLHKEIGIMYRYKPLFFLFDSSKAKAMNNYQEMVKKYPELRTKFRDDINKLIRYNVLPDDGTSLEEIKAFLIRIPL